MKSPEEIAAEIWWGIRPPRRNMADAIRAARREGAEAALALVAERLQEAGDDVGFRVVSNTENPFIEPKEPA